MAGGAVGEGENGERETGKETMVGACVGRRGEGKTHGSESRRRRGRGDPACKHATLSYRQNPAQGLRTAEVGGRERGEG